MRLGIFSRTYDENSLDAVFQKMTSQGIYETQFNLLSAGLNTMPEYVDDEAIDQIIYTAKKYKVSLTALSGTFNMIDPDIEARKEGCLRFDVLCRIARQLNIPLVTLCTGSKNLESKWKWHPDNDLKASYEDLLQSTEQVLMSAEENNIVLGIEIEASNIIHSSQLARKYLDQVGSEKLKIIMDGANLFQPTDVTHMTEKLEEAFDLLGKDIVLAHAKDIVVSDNVEFVAAGKGMLDFNLYIKLLKKSSYEGPLIMHGLSELQVPESIAFLKEISHE